MHSEIREPVKGASAPAPPAARSVLATLNDDGSRKWLSPRLSHGRFLTRRRAVAYFLIALYTLIPWLKINGKQAILLDLATRRFDILGKTFLPTDTVLLALLLVGTFLTIFFLTALFGRVWCGWACPQTVYMEFVFRPIERLCEGAPGRAKNWLQKSPARKAVKYLLYLIVAAHLANTFLCYFAPTETIVQWTIHSPAEHPVGFAVFAAVTALMMFDFSFFREQTCLVACPYGRFQSVLLDDQSVIVAYDKARGEPRGKAKKVSLPVVGDAPQQGDCIDCTMCVQTCPTGIDIRNGLQMECVHCTQCIDACDAIMDKVGRPRGLIAYRSQAMLSGTGKHLLRARTLIYPAILLIIGALFVTILVNQAPAYVRVLRGLGRPFTEIEPGVIANPIKLKIINRRDTAQTYAIAATDGVSSVRMERATLTLAPGETGIAPGLLVAPSGSFKGGHYHAAVRVTDSAGYASEMKWEMLGPANAEKK